MTDRAQSHVVGVALLMGVAVVALGGLTAGIGTLVEDQAASADATRVADEFDAALNPVETTGTDRGRVRFSAGRLETVEREVRVLDSSGVQHTIDAGGLVFESGDRRVAYVSDAIVRSVGDSVWVHDPPPVTAGRGGDVVILSVTRLNASDVAVAGDDAAVTLRSNVSHERTALGRDEHAIAVETSSPAALERWFRERGADVDRRDFDGDGVESVVATFPGRRTGYLVVHDVRLEVGHG